MTNQEILEKAIQKAAAAGWAYPFKANTYEIVKYMPARPESIAFGFREDWQDDDTPGHLEGHWSIEELIFDHDFAKSFFGEEPYYRFDGDTLDTPKQWEFHLKEMVVSPDPIKYLEKFV